MPVGDRGRLSPDLVRAYEAEHGLASAPAQRRQSSRAAARKQQPPSGNGRVVHARTPWDWPRRG